MSRLVNMVRTRCGVFELRDDIDTSARCASNFQTTTSEPISPKRIKRDDCDVGAGSHKIGAGVCVSILCDTRTFISRNGAELARHSGFFAGALANAALRLGVSDNVHVDLRGNGFVSEETLAIAMRFVSEGVASLNDLDDGDVVVALARCASYLQMACLSAAVEELLCAAVDDANCVSLFGLAGELALRRLSRTCTRTLLEHYLAVSTRDDFAALPPRQRRRLAILHALKAHFGVCALGDAADGDEGGGFPDERTLAAMLRESLVEQRERYEEAVVLALDDEESLRMRPQSPTSEARIAKIRAVPRQQLVRQQRRLSDLEGLIASLVDDVDGAPLLRHET